MQTKVIYYSTMVLTLLLVNRVNGQEEHQRRVRHQRSSANRTQTEWDRDHNENQNEVLGLQWKCLTPKPRLVNWSEAIDQPPPVIPPSERLTLDVTVMHRCDACTGYCSNNHETGLPRTCQAVEKERVTKTFKSHSMNQQNPVFYYYHITFYNHTRCGCA